MFAKPFLGVLSGHSDSVSVITKCPSSLVKVISGTFDGEIRAWDLSERKTLFALNAHK
jgi:WD repeat and SOF domain-containing protein 1